LRFRHSERDDRRDDSAIEENVAYLNELHRLHFLRYPRGASRPIPDLSIIADATVDHLLNYITLFNNPL